MVRRLADEGMTVLMVEHRVEDVLRIHPDRVMFMDDGEHPLPGRRRMDWTRRWTTARSSCRPAVIMQRAKDDPPPNCDQAPSRCQQRESEASPLVQFRGCALLATSESTKCCTASTWRSGAAMSSPCWARTAPARPPWSSMPSGCSSQSAGGCWWMGSDTHEAERGADRQHAGLCLPKPQPHALRPHRARGTGLWTDQPASIPRRDRKGGGGSAPDRQPGRARRRPAAGAVLWAAETGQHRRHPGDALPHPGDGRTDRRAGLPELHEFHGCHPAAARL